MKNVANKLGLNEEANETSILNAIANIEAINKTKMEDAEDRLKKANDALDAAKMEVENLKAANKELVDKAKVDADNKIAADAIALETTAKADVDAAVKVGKIKNDATLIASYVDMYKENPVRTKSVLDALPSSKKSPEFHVVDTDIKDSAAEAAARANGIKPGTAAWYNSITAYNASNPKK